MRRLLIAAVLGAAVLAGAGCSGCALLRDEAVLGQTLADEKALLSLEAGFYGANAAAEAAVDSGLIVPGSPLAVQVADELARANSGLLLARSAYNAGDAVGYPARLAQAQAFVAQAWTLIPRRSL